MPIPIFCSAQRKASRLPALLAFLLGVLLAPRTFAQETKPFLHPLFADNAVLERDQVDPVWGWTNPGKTVTVALDDRAVTAQADASGRWQAQIGPYPAGGPHTLTVSEPGGPTITRQGILFGEVWLCSGQSNMEWQMNFGIDNLEAERAAANYPEIHFLTLPHAVAAQPQDTFDSTSTAWKPCTPQVAGTSSAVAYYFGRRLFQDLHVPIGLIVSAWGGTKGESWASAPALKQMPDFSDQLATVDAQIAAQQAPYTPYLHRWLAANAANGPTAPDFDDSTWPALTAPGNWESLGIKELSNFEGIVWMRREVDVPAAWAGHDLTLKLGRVQDLDVAYWNGAELGFKNSSLASEFTVPRDQIKTGRNVISVCIAAAGYNGGFTGQPDDMRLQMDDANSVSLAGPWKYQIGRPAAAWQGPIPHDRPNGNIVSGLFNGMIAPLVPYNLKGAIWYQGESNMGHAEQYGRLLPILINDWRDHFGRQLAFYIVHLAGYMQKSGEPGGRLLPDMREAQSRAAAKVGHSGIAVTTDIGDETSLHPHNKKDVGERLALIALAQDYGEKVEYLGPTVENLTITGSILTLTLGHADGALTFKGESERVFALAGADKKFYWASPVITGNTIALTSPEVPAPVAVRYAWANFPRASLYNGAGLPMAPYRSDDW